MTVYVEMWLTNYSGEDDAQTAFSGRYF